MSNETACGATPPRHAVARGQAQAEDSANGPVRTRLDSGRAVESRYARTPGPAWSAMILPTPTWEPASERAPRDELPGECPPART